MNWTAIEAIGTMAAACVGVIATIVSTCVAIMTLRKMERTIRTQFMPLITVVEPFLDWNAKNGAYEVNIRNQGTGGAILPRVYVSCSQTSQTQIPYFFTQGLPSLGPQQETTLTLQAVNKERLPPSMGPDSLEIHYQDIFGNKYVTKASISDDNKWGNVHFETPLF